MDIQLFNSRSHQLELFEPIKADEVGIYTCGPTAYGYAHLGNLRSFLFADGLRRILEYLGFATKHVMNITDVGHLVNDGDDGEDKVELAAQKEGKSAWEIASFYTDAFLSDTALLNIHKPHIIAKATAHIPEQIALIEQLEAKGYTYLTPDGVYFDTSKFEGYGPMSGQPLEDLLAGARVEANPDKRNPADFALWKISEVGSRKSEVRADPFSVLCHSERPDSSQGVEESGENSDNTRSFDSQAPTSRDLGTQDDKRVGVGHRQMEWNSPWGVGFPGWHIECSAMSTKYLGQPFDIHTGGIDLMFPHHTDEIAQSEAANGVPMANYWLHGEFMTVENSKMAKSVGNTYTLQEATDRGYEPMAFRYLMLGAHYRKPINFTWESLHSAQQGLNNLRAIVRTLPASDTPGVSDGHTYTPGVSDVDTILEESFRTRIADDLGLPQALALLWEVLKSDRSSEAKAAAVAQWDQVLGLGLASELGKQEDIPADVEALAEQREQARQAGEYAQADQLRKQIEEAGYTVKDTASGPVLSAHDHSTEL